MHKDFDEWFNSLSKEDQDDYIKELEADYWVDYYKANPYLE